jgi:hypothetical protein
LQYSDSFIPTNLAASHSEMTLVMLGPTPKYCSHSRATLTKFWRSSSALPMTILALLKPAPTKLARHERNRAHRRCDLRARPGRATCGFLILDPRKRSRWFHRRRAASAPGTEPVAAAKQELSPGPHRRYKAVTGTGHPQALSYHNASVYLCAPRRLLEPCQAA